MRVGREWQITIYKEDGEISVTYKNFTKMGKVDIVFVLIFIFVTMTVKTRALPLPDDTKCKAGIYHDFLSAYKFWTKDSPELPIPEIMEQIVCLLHDVKSLKSQVFDLKRKLHRRNRINSTSNK